MERRVDQGQPLGLDCRVVGPGHEVVRVDAEHGQRSVTGALARDAEASLDVGHGVRTTR